MSFYEGEKLDITDHCCYALDSRSNPNWFPRHLLNVAQSCYHGSIGKKEMSADFSTVYTNFMGVVLQTISVYVAVYCLKYLLWI